MTTATALARLGEDELGALFTQAHTANAFAPTPVSDETLRELHELTKMPPSAMNSQPLRVLWVRSEAARERLGSFMSEGNRDKTAQAPLVAVLAYDARWHEYLETLAPFRASAKESIDANVGMRESMAKLNAAIQAGYFLLAARSLGLDVGPQGGFDHAGVDAAFFAENGWRSFAVVNLGYPAADGAGYRGRQGRLSYEEQTLTV